MIRKLGTSLLILLLLGVSVMFYLVQFLIFRRPADTGFYLLQDLAFVPISVLLVTLGLNTIMVYRQRQQMLEKVSIVINEFFAEAGTDLIRCLHDFFVNFELTAPRLQPVALWRNQDFDAAIALLGHTPVEANASRSDLSALALLLTQKKDQILRLFENANLLEHDRFTDMLWAVYHVYDELRSRLSLADLPASDLRHLSGDIQRAAQLLLIEWLESMRQLKARYPYLYSLAVRKSPFGAGHVLIMEP
jgi:hypothetical protein